MGWNSLGRARWALLLVVTGLNACSQQLAKESTAAQTVPSAPTTAASATSGTTSTPQAQVQSAASSVVEGQAIYDRACAMCHNSPEATRSPSLDTLHQMRYQQINFALTQGKMQTQASGLSADEKVAVIEFLVGRDQAKDDWATTMKCTARRATFNSKVAASVTGFGFDRHNHRHLSAAQAGLRTQDFANLELAWSIGFPGATTMRAQPAVVGSTVFLPVADTQRLYALDVAGEPCIKWVYENDIPLRTSVAYGELEGSKRPVLVFADLGSFIHMLDAATGQELWRQHVGLYQYSLTTGAPVLYKDRVYAPISQYEITIGANDKHECCKTHGAVTALDAVTGAKIWTAHTMEDAKPIRDRGDGQMLWGPSGAPIWNTPVIDEKRGVLYVGTGEATSEPAAKTTDAVLAIDLKDGAIRWSFQATENDIFLSGCGPQSKGLNCSKNSVYRDVDFGASMILAKRPDGSEVVLAGQKSGTLWALNPDTGKVTWRQDFGEGSPLGGIHWGIAFDGERVFAPINRPYGFSAPAGGVQKPGIHAVDVGTGKVLWSFAAEPDCSDGRDKRLRNCASNIGLSAAPAVIDGAVVTGSLDGVLRVFDAKSGAQLFRFDTSQAFTTVNGVKANGGSIDSASIVAANGYLLVNSGYGMFGQTPGNVMLAFKVKGAR